MSYKIVNHIIRNKSFQVYKVKDVWTRQRLFCILDKNLPFEFGLVYKEPHSEMDLSPIIGKNGGFMIHETMRENKTYTFRFGTQDECDFHKNIIKEKQLWVENIVAELNEELKRKYSK